MRPWPDGYVYLALSGRNIGQSGSTISRKIIRLRLIESLPSKQVVGGSSPRRVGSIDSVTDSNAPKENAAKVVLAHPHPSGMAELPHTDEIITRRLADALVLVDVRMRGHIIDAREEIRSFAQSGGL